MSSIARFKGLEAQGDAFVCELIAVAGRLRTEPDYLAAVMRIESGFRPEATNPFTQATGLIQFMPNTAKSLGTSVDDLRAMTALQQLPYVESFYAPHAGRIDSAGTAYMLTFLPAYARRPDDFVLGEDSSEEVLPGSQLTKGAVYKTNKGFDRTGKGYFTVGDVKSLAEASRRGGEANGRLELACDAPPADDTPTESAWWLWLFLVPPIWKRFFR